MEEKNGDKNSKNINIYPIYVNKNEEVHFVSCVNYFFFWRKSASVHIVCCVRKSLNMNRSIHFQPTNKFIHTT
jgi:hypothetical protein